MRIISDTTCHLSANEAKERGILLIPNQIIHREQVIRDYLDISSSDFMELLKIDYAKTSQPAFGEVIEAYEKTAPEDTLHITTGDGLSGAYNNACSAKESIQANHVQIFHSRSVAGVNHYLTLLAHKLTTLDYSIQEIIQRLNRCVSQTQSYVIPTDFSFLQKSGRLTKTAAVLGGLLKLKPVMAQSEDKKKIDKFAINRTWQSAINSVIHDLVAKKVDVQHKIYVLHAFNEDIANQAIQAIKRSLGNVDIQSLLLSPAMITHGGPGCVVIQSVLKDSLDLK